MKKFSISLPDATVSDIDAAAAAAGIPRSEWIREACTLTIAGGNPAEDSGTLAETLGTLERTREDLAQMTAERDRLAAELQTAEDQARTAAAERDRLTVRIRDLEDQAAAHEAEIRAAVAEAIAAERLARIEDLQNTAGTIARVSRPELSPAEAGPPATATAPAETAAPVRRPWPYGWIDDVRGRR